MPKHLLNFKVTDAEHDLVRELANRHGRNVSEEVRHALASRPNATLAQNASQTFDSGTGNCASGWR